jgi:hypothetical protein
MPLYSWMLSSLLVCQAAADPAVPVLMAPPGAATPATPMPSSRPSSPFIPTGTAQAPAAVSRPTTAQLVADALAPSPDGAVSGRAVPLVSVIATAPTRQRQTEAVHAYWRLAEAVGDYHFCSLRQQRLARLKVRNDEAADLRAVQAVATAEIRDAELRITTAQNDLAETLHLAPGTPLPLPADQPLVGPYRTLFAEVFAGKTAPESARMLDQTLPLRNQAIENHAAALLAAEDSFDAAVEVQAEGQGRLDGVIRAADALLKQQRAFMAAVGRYNHDIADYALVAVSPQTTPELLVGTLIKQNRPAAQPAAPLPTRDSAALPAAYQQPLSGGASVPPAILVAPTRADQPAGIPPQAPETSRRVNTAENLPQNPPVVSPPGNTVPSNDPEEPRLAPPQESAIPIAPQKSPSGPTPHTSEKPIDRLPSPSGRGAGGEGLPPEEQAVKLTAALYLERSDSSQSGDHATVKADQTPATRLIDCLRLVPANRRTDVVTAYWNARRHAAQYQSLAEQIQWLEAVGPALSAQNPPSPTALLVFRAARRAVDAELADAQADRRAADLELAGLVGLDFGKIAAQYATVPFVGQFRPRDSLPNASWPLRRLEATLPRRQQAIIDQAMAVVAADSWRGAATSDFLAGRCSLDRVLAAIETQARGISAFLRDVTEYNRAIAEYVTATLPADAGVEKYAAVLMVECSRLMSAASTTIATSAGPGIRSK